MAQYNVYSNATGGSGAPGLMTGQAAEILRVLDKCLVTGWTGVAAAGWSKPIANSGNIGCYLQGAGSGFGVVVNDNGPNVTSTFKEAWATGWESIAGIGAPVGSGGGQFPLPAQLLTSGHVVWRKSTLADGTGRAWTLFADASTFILFMATADAAGVYYPGYFGDIFSIKATADAYRCAIIGSAAENTPGNSSSHAMDRLGVMQTAQSGHFLARTYAGTGSSITFSKIGDMALLTGAQGDGATMIGNVQAPNGPDSGWHLAPLRVAEVSGTLIRGRLRGLYHVCHPLASFSDGQILTGANEYAGKSFQIVSKGTSSGFWAVDISNSLDTN